MLMPHIKQGIVVLTWDPFFSLPCILSDHIHVQQKHEINTW